MYHDYGIILSDITTPDEALTAILSLAENQLKSNDIDTALKALSQIVEIIKYLSIK